MRTNAQVRLQCTHDQVLNLLQLIQFKPNPHNRRTLVWLEIVNVTTINAKLEEVSPLKNLLSFLKVSNLVNDPTL